SLVFEGGQPPAAARPGAAAIIGGGAPPMPCSANRSRAASMIRVWAAVYAAEPSGFAPARLARMAGPDRWLARIAETVTGCERNTPLIAPEPLQTPSARAPAGERDDRSRLRPGADAIDH